MSAFPRTTTATAPGKIILLGEHAVVYGRPAIAVPVTDVTVTATIRDCAAGSGCTILAHDLGHTVALDNADSTNPLAFIVQLTLAELQLPDNPDWQIEIHSQIPIAGGLGSGAAVSTAICRAIFTHSGHAPDPSRISALVYRSEELYHGTPSGIDNTVIAYAMPIWFVKGGTIEPFTSGNTFTMVIADSGISSPTKETVADVRRQWQAEPARFEAIFDEIAALVHAARRQIEYGTIDKLGALMDQNQLLLEALGVSSPRLQTLIEAARQAGAWGAKLSGGGRGGNVIALVEDARVTRVSAALTEAGAKRVLTTQITATQQRD